MMCLTNEGKVSNNRRKQYQYSVTPQAFDFIEQTAQHVLAEQRADDQPRDHDQEDQPEAARRCHGSQVTMSGSASVTTRRENLWPDFTISCMRFSRTLRSSGVKGLSTEKS